MHNWYCKENGNFILFFTRFSGIVDEPVEPQLIGDSINSTSVGLRWDISSLSEYSEFSEFEQEPLLPVTFMIQQRQEGQEWEYNRATGIIETNETDVTDLLPYTRYQVKFDCYFNLLVNF